MAALILLALIGALAGAQYRSLPSDADLARLRSAQVHDTAMIRQRVEEAAARGKRLQVRQTWVELEQISEPAITAVVTSEDSRFFSHGALDVAELSNALHDTLEEGKALRGASTLTQQVAKNLYLGGSRSYLRKLKEAYLAWRLDRTLSKRRILRLYLNIAEWGPGIFGIEAAAQAHLHKHASELTLAEGAALAAMLPNPHRISPQAPALLHARASHVLDRCLDDHVATADEVAEAQSALDQWLGAPAPLSEDALSSDDERDAAP